ncbi:hypothetical protein ACFL1X_07130 [Candidatus Hydrogenedentota bacterium]
MSKPPARNVITLSGNSAAVTPGVVTRYFYLEEWRDDQSDAHTQEVSARLWGKRTELADVKKVRE